MTHPMGAKLRPLLGHVNNPIDARKIGRVTDVVPDPPPDPLWRLELEDLLWAVATPAGDQTDYERIVAALMEHYPEGEPTLEAAYALGGKEALRSMLTAVLVAQVEAGHDRPHALEELADAACRIRAPRSNMVVALAEGAITVADLAAATEPRWDGRRLTAPDGSGDPNAPRYPLPQPPKRAADLDPAFTATILNTNPKATP